MADIFISYASADRERARQLADALAQRGYAVWWDRTIPPGRVFDEVIQEAIQAARCMIVLWSADSVRSNWVKTEAAEGVARGILVPVLLGDVAPPIEFKRIQSANLSQWPDAAADGEFRGLLDSIERLMKQAPRGESEASRTPQPHRFASQDWPGKSYLQTIKTFAYGCVTTLVVIGGYWLFTHSGKVASPSPPASVNVPQDAGKAAANLAPPAAGAAASPVTKKGRVNLLAAENGGQLLVASTDRWSALIDGKEDTYVWVDTGFGVFGFRDGKRALIDTFTVLIPSQSDNNLQTFELFVGNVSATGPFESIGRFTTQNMRMMQDPYQAFKFAPVSAKYFKFQSLAGHDSRSAVAIAHEIQLFGVLQ